MLSVDDIPAPPSPWRGVSSDSRQIRPGYAFVAVRGEHEDGHRFIAEAIQNGAGSIYTERPESAALPVPHIHVRDTRIALAELAARYYEHPAERLRCVGATGTNGKTTTTSLLQWILNVRARQAGLIGTVQSDNGRSVTPAHLTTPDPVAIHRQLSEMAGNGLTHAVLEVSSHGLKQRRVHGIRFATAMFTNLSADHFDYHADVREYVETKAELFRALAADGAAIVNLDDRVAPIIAGASAAPVYTYSCRPPRERPNSALPLDIECVRAKVTPAGTELQLVLSARVRSLHHAAQRAAGRPAEETPGVIRLQTPLLGRHNIANVLAAVGASFAEGIPLTQIARGVATFTGVWRRLQRVSIAGPLVIDDCCHNPSSYEAAFEMVASLSRRRLFVVNAIRGNRGEEINRLNSRALADWAAVQRDLRLWITDCNECAPQTDIVSEAERKVFFAELEQQRVAFEHQRTLDACLIELVDILQPGDLALLLGAHAMDHAAERFSALWKARRQHDAEPAKRPADPWIATARPAI